MLFILQCKAELNDKSKHTKSHRFSVFLEDFKMFNTALLLSSTLYCTKKYHSLLRTHSAHPNSFLVQRRTELWQDAQGFINVFRFLVIRARICKQEMHKML